MLLIVSNKTDLATDFLILRLKERAIPFVRINTEDYLKKWDVQFFLNSREAHFSIQFNDSSCLTREMVSGAYIRQPKLPIIDVAVNDKSFADREIGESLKSLWRLIDDNIWLNAPHHLLRASNKPEQLMVASKMGFTIPETCVTSDKNIMLGFYCDNNKNVIVKAVKHGFLYDGVNAKVAATQLLDEEVIETFDQYARIPMILQERIHKQYDIRVTIVGDKVFATAIHSQDFRETEVDWRLANHHKLLLKHELIQLPNNISELCMTITQHFNLTYAAIDLILSKDDEYYFLELNPNGQWAWIEQETGVLIRDAIIDELIHNKGEKDGIY